MGESFNGGAEFTRNLSTFTFEAVNILRSSCRTQDARSARQDALRDGE